MIVLVVVSAAFHVLILTWWAYNSGYHQGWMDHAEGKTTYTRADVVPSFAKGGIVPGGHTHALLQAGEEVLTREQWENRS